jgi:hypothetical protein
METTIMPFCRSCGRYYTKHAALCPTCHPPLWRQRHPQPAIESARALPVVGDVYIDPNNGVAFKIIAVSLVEGAMWLELSDGSFIECGPEFCKTGYS